jgi:hypothetical protein
MKRMATSRPHIRKATIRPRKAAQEYFIWCDESNTRGKLCSNFYGGVLVKSTHLREVLATLQQVCRKLHLFDEIKWHKVSPCYAGKYKQAMDAFFQLVADDKVKVRIMFTQNGNHHPQVTRRLRRSEGFFLLYQQFIQHAFGLSYSNTSAEAVYLRLYFDCLPDKVARRQSFKEDIKALQRSQPFQTAHVKIRKQDIAEVDSKKHLLLQMLDVVLGSIGFRLNNRHREIPKGRKRRGQGTLAKESLYKHIQKKLRELRPGFSISASTGVSCPQDYWNHPYRHWVFQPSEYEMGINLFQ